MFLNLIIGPAYSGKSEGVLNLLDKSRPATFYTVANNTHPALSNRHNYLQDLRKSFSANRWHTVETNDLSSEISSHKLSHTLVLDSTYCWLSNLIVQKSTNGNFSPEQILQIVNHESDMLLKNLESFEGGQGFILSTEVGGSIPASNPYERLLREVNGKLNQKLGTLCTKIYSVTAGHFNLIKNI